MIELTDEILSAYLDEEVTPQERAAIEAALEASPSARARLERIEANDRALRAANPLKTVRLDDPLARRIRASFAQSAPAGEARASFLKTHRAAFGALAAGLVGVIAGQSLEMAPLSVGSEAIGASAALARVLDEQPSGVERDGVRVLFSFNAKDGAPCRQFAAASTHANAEGVACRDGGVWRVVAWTRAAKSDGGFHAAGAEEGLIDAVVDRIDASGALSDDQEQAQIDRRWGSR